MRASTFAMALVASAFLPSTAAAGEWEKAADDDGIEVYSREVEGSDIKEMKAYGKIDAPPERVLAVLADVDRYSETMPYTELSKLKKRTGNVIWFYTVINAPLVSRREYGIRITISKLPDGRLKSEWVPANEVAPPPNDDLVRIVVNNGYWLLSPVAGGKRTEAVYFVKTDPGGSLPTFIINKANSQAVPDVFRAIRKAVATARYANAVSPLVEEAAPQPAPGAAPPGPAPAVPAPAPAPAPAPGK